MPIDVDVYAEIIYITSPTTDVTIQELYDATRATEDSTVGFNFDDIIILGEGKTDVGGGFLNPATMKLNPNWYIEFWDGVLLGTVAGGNVTGGLDERPVRATPGSADTVLVLGAERGIISADAIAISGQIADAVWDEQTADHTTISTFGGEIAQKSDVQGGATTSEDIADSGTVIDGNLISGDYTSTWVKDGIYWVIQEDTTAPGLEIEQTFYLPEGNKPGNITAYGRYTGKPAGSHYLQLFAYNYDASQFELLEAIFFPGGDLGDDTHVAAFFERNIDRTNNQEVKIRIKHIPVAPYSTSHYLYLDYIEASSIEVLTAQFIADAVWDEPLTGHDGPASAGLSQQTQDYNGRIIFDTAGTPGTLWPIGTHKFPSNNLDDTITLAGIYNVDNIRLHTDITIGAAQDVRGFRIDTHGRMNTQVTLVFDALLDSAAFFNVDITGEITGTDVIQIQESSVGNLLNFTGIMNNVAFQPGASLEVNLWATIIQATCGGDAATGLNLKLNGGMVNFSHFTGYLNITDKIGASLSTISSVGADINIDATCVAGTIHLNGVGHLVADNSGPGCTIVNDMTNPETTAVAVWDAEEAKRLLGLMHENIFIDNPVYDGDGNLTGARVRLYSVAGSVGTGSDVIGTYAITAPSSAPGQFNTWKQVKI